MPMETAEILHQFERATGKFARAAVEAAVARREEVTPELLRILEDTVDRAAQIDAEGDYMAHLYAMFLLAQFRETRAYPLVVRFASLPGDLLDSLCGDFITEDLGQVLASVCGGELAGIQSLIENEDTDEWVRGAALSSLVTLVAAGQKSRDEIVSYFAGLFRGKLVRQWSHVWDTLVSYSSDLYPEELLDDIERAYEEGLVDPGYIGFRRCQTGLGDGQRIAFSRDSQTIPIDAWCRTPWRRWDGGHAFGRIARAERKASAPSSAKSNLNPAAGASPIKRATPKTGRNEPCPCGSGKKYKKCCGA